MSNTTPWIFVDCEARGISAVHGVLTEFGAVHYDTRDTFHGRLFDATPDPGNPAISIVGDRIATDEEVAESFAAWLQEHLGNRRPVFVSDNPAYDWQWIAGMFDRAGMDNPFGHSGRRISDFWAGLNRDWSETQGWKRFRRTAHDHNPVHDEVKQFLAVASGEVRLDVRSLHARRNRLQFFRSTALMVFRALNEVERDLRVPCSFRASCAGRA